MELTLQKMPVKGKGMMDKIKIEQVMNNFAPVASANYVYAEAADSSQGKLGMANLASLIQGNTGLGHIKIKQHILHTTSVISEELKNGLYFFINNEVLYGFCDLVSICKNNNPKISIISKQGYGNLITETNNISAGQRCIYINTDTNKIEFRQRSATVTVIIGSICV